MAKVNLAIDMATPISVDDFAFVFALLPLPGAPEAAPAAASKAASAPVDGAPEAPKLSKRDQKRLARGEDLNAVKKEKDKGADKWAVDPAKAAAKAEKAALLKAEKAAKAEAAAAEELLCRPEPTPLGERPATLWIVVSWSNELLRYRRAPTTTASKRAMVQTRGRERLIKTWDIAGIEHEERRRRRCVSK